MRRGENRSTRRKTSRSKDENQQQTQPTFDAESWNRTRATLVGGLRGRRMLNHCVIPAPQSGHQTPTKPTSTQAIVCLSLFSQLLDRGKTLEESLEKLEQERQRSEQLLYRMMPKAVADRLRDGQKAIETCEVF